MSTCTECGATVGKKTAICGNCNAKIDIQATSESIPQQDASTPTLSTPNVGDMSARLEKALRRTEMLSFAAAGLGIAIFVVLMIIYFGYI